MGLLSEREIKQVHHYTPLHYLPFIGRSKFLLCKPSLLAAGFAESHFRSMSRSQDVERGFGSYAHLTLQPRPRILKAKLNAGFPHIGLLVPVRAIEAVSFSLCRFNVAMTRYLRRNGFPGFPESETNGRYYDKHQIPIAREESDKIRMLDKHLPLGTMIEVLVHGDLLLPDDAEVRCFSDDDTKLAQDILSKVGAPWSAVSVSPPEPYTADKKHVGAVHEFVNKALAEPEWRGNGLEFDRL